MSPAGFEPSIPASERPQTHLLDRAATSFLISHQVYMYSSSLLPSPVEMQCMACTVFEDWNTEILCSNPMRNMDVFLFPARVLSCVGSGHAKGRSLFWGIVPVIYEMRLKPGKSKALDSMSRSSVEIYKYEQYALFN
jgi:hypothetical protein